MAQFVFSQRVHGQRFHPADYSFAFRFLGGSFYFEILNEAEEEGARDAGEEATPVQGQAPDAEEDAPGQQKER